MTQPQSTARAVISIEDCRADFPALQQSINNQPLVYLDSAASSQQPASVIDAVADYQRHDHANVHRGVHTLSHRATDAYEGARDKVQRFINAGSRSEVVLTSGTTESINLVAQSYCRPLLQPGDKVLISHLEHHSNIVPWQLLCQQTGAELVVAPIDDRGQLDTAQFLALLDEQVRFVAIAHVSNALGSINPVAEIIAQAKQIAGSGPAGRRARRPAHADRCAIAGLRLLRFLGAQDVRANRCRRAVWSRGVSRGYAALPGRW